MTSRELYALQRRFETGVRIYRQRADSRRAVSGSTVYTTYADAIADLYRDIAQQIEALSVAQQDAKATREL